MPGLCYADAPSLQAAAAAVQLQPTTVVMQQQTNFKIVVTQFKPKMSEAEGTTHMLLKYRII